MSGGSRTWAVRLAAAAESDFQDILRRSAQRFGFPRLLHDAMDLPRHVPRDDLSE